MPLSNMGGCRQVLSEEKEARPLKGICYRNIVNQTEIVSSMARPDSVSKKNYVFIEIIMGITKTLSKISAIQSSS